MTLSKMNTYGGDKKCNGWIIPFYKKTDDLFKEYDLNFIYASSVLPGSKKGPHVHMKRECRLIVISGEVEIVTRENGEYIRYCLSSSNPDFKVIKTGTPFCVENKGDKEAIILNLANHIWTEDDKDNHQVTDWHYTGE